MPRKDMCILHISKCWSLGRLTLQWGVLSFLSLVGFFDAELAGNLQHLKNGGVNKRNSSFSAKEKRQVICKP